MIDVFGLALYGPESAASRYRLMQYKNGLNSNNINLVINHLLSKEYLDWRFHNHIFPVYKTIISFFIRAIKIYFNKKDFKLLIIHCELFPYIPFFVEKIILHKSKYIYDFDDAFYLRYEKSNFIVKKLLKSKFNYLIKNASAVTAGNHFLYEKAKTLNQNVFYLPTVLDPYVFFST
jgi:hypothetical protein